MIISTVLAVISSVLCVGLSSANTLLSGNSIAESVKSELGTDLIEKTQRIRDRAIDWLLTRRTEEYGWPLGDTARVLIALSSALEDWPQKNDLAARLSVKQLEIEILEKFLRKDIDPVTPAKEAFYSLALNAACKDPHNFHGHNLIASLEKHHEDADFPGYPETFGYSLAAMVTCLSGSHLHKRQSKHLLQIAREENTEAFSIDTRGMALMALECIRHRKNSQALSRHMHDPLAAISETQKPDGSFGNIHTSALAIQVLAGSVDVELQWNRTAAILYLATLQEPNGSFLNNVPATTESVIASSALLNNAGVLGLRKNRCSLIRHRSRTQNQVTAASSSVVDGSTSSNYHLNNKIPRYGVNDQNVRLNEPNYAIAHQNQAAADVNDNSVLGRHDEETVATQHREKSFSTTQQSPTSISKKPSPVQLVNVEYWLWIGPDPVTADKRNLTLQVSVNSTFFYVMQRAAEMSPDFEFSSTVWPNGHYVHTIAGHREQPIGYHYWLLYCLKSDPDPLAPPSTTFVAPAGVDDLRVQDGQIYLFWFKKI